MAYHQYRISIMAKVLNIAGRYPAGDDDFENIREKKCVYIDKTAYIYRMTREKYVFLSRPRRFGKSLLCSTMKAYFEGRKELFEGLAIETLDKEWKAYPVLHFNVSTLKDKLPHEMILDLGWQLSRYEDRYGANPQEVTPGMRLQGVITRARAQSKERVVVIIDEYDAPVLHYMNDEADKPEVKRIMQEFYTPLKACSADLRFVFITGITKFSQLSIFSTINNLSDISMDTAYAAVCGFAQSELDELLHDDIEYLAEKRGMTYEECHATLKRQYDGYHFCEDSEDIYNPYSLMKCFQQQKIKDYWFESGTVTSLLETMRRFDTQVMKLEGAEAEASAFAQPIERMTDALPFIYQSGYLTIKDYNPVIQSYTLSIPNNEVRTGLMKNILPMLSSTSEANNSSYASRFISQLYNRQYDEAMQTLRAFLASIPYLQQGKDLLQDLSRFESLYQTYLYIFFCGMGLQVHVEVMMARGRVDMVMWMGERIFIFEFKMSASAESALAQIDGRQYIEPWKTGKIQIVKCGARFDAAERTVTQWRFEEI